MHSLCEEDEKKVKKVFVLLLFVVCLMGFSGCNQNDKGGNNQTVDKTEEPTFVPTKEPTPEPTVAPTPEPTIEPTPIPEVVTDEATVQGMAEEIMQGMTLEEKIGQMFIVNFELLDDSQGSFYEFRDCTDAMKTNMVKYPVGGVIFFSRNIETREQTSQFIIDLQNQSKVPLFVAVDEEGGDVARIANNDNMKTTKFPSMQQVGILNNKDYAYDIGTTIGREIKELGFNLDFAPVADVKTNQSNTEIGNRSVGSDPKKVASMITQIVKGLQEQGISATLKHFPGHGDVDGDSHQGAVNVENDIQRLRKIDFVPFKSGIKAGADFIMVSHISISRVTEDTVPSSLSSLVMKEMLRDELGFKGIIITDALNMKAITNDYSASEAAVTAVSAGTDILLMPENIEESFRAVLEAVQDGTISEDQINQSVTRILETKIKRGLILSNTELIYK